MCNRFLLTQCSTHHKSDCLDLRDWIKITTHHIILTVAWQDFPILRKEMRLIQMTESIWPNWYLVRWTNKMKTADTCRNSIISPITVLNFLTTDTKINCIFQRSLNYNKFGLLKRCQFGNIDLVMGWNLKTIIHFSPFSVNLTCPTWNMSNKFPSYPYSWFLWHDIIFSVYSSCIFPLICLLHDWWHKICHSQT